MNLACRPRLSWRLSSSTRQNLPDRQHSQDAQHLEEMSGMICVLYILLSSCCFCTATANQSRFPEMLTQIFSSWGLSSSRSAEKTVDLQRWGVQANRVSLKDRLQPSIISRGCRCGRLWLKVRRTSQQHFLWSDRLWAWWLPLMHVSIALLVGGFVPWIKGFPACTRSYGSPLGVMVVPWLSQV